MWYNKFLTGFVDGGMSVKKKKIITVLIIFACLIAISILAVFGVNAYVKYIGGRNIITSTEAQELNDIDCVLILGCQVKGNGKPSDMLSDRLKRGIELYEQETAPKIIMSGDHGSEVYDEVNAMKQTAIDEGVPSSDIFMDHAGFSTYESMYRAKEIFKAEKIIIVTQEYHLFRALYVAEKLGLDAYGVSSDYHSYRGQSIREAREIFARCKDFVMTVFKPKPTYLGEAVPVSGDGDITND